MKSARKKLHRIRPKLDKSLRTLKRKSFTLIELLIVIAILGILAAAVLVAINPGKRMGQARDAQRKNDLGQLKNALETYNVVYGSYPSTGCTGCWFGDAVNFGGFGYEGPGGYIPNLAPDSIKKLPQDPRGHTPGANSETAWAGCKDAVEGPKNSGYLYSSNGTDFKLMAHCTPENYDDQKFVDPARSTWAYAVWSSDTSKNW